jgi:Ca2+-transporting ATPase
MTLCGIVAAQVGNVIACRTERESVFRVGIFRNRLVLWGIAAEIALLLGLIVTPPMARVFGLAALAPREWTPLLAFPLVIVALEEGRKAVVRWRGRPPSSCAPARTARRSSGSACRRGGCSASAPRDR